MEKNSNYSNYHTILHCKKCGYFSALDTIHKAICPDCGYEGYQFVQIRGTKEEIVDYMKKQEKLKI